MGYYADYDGFITLKGAPSKEINDLINEIMNVYEYDKEKYTYYVSGNDKYYEDDMYRLFSELDGMTKSGEIRFDGEDSSLWRFVYKDGAWIEESGEVVYDGEKPQIRTNEDKLEFLCAIIDIFEDFLEEKKVWWENDEREDDSSALFYGTEYGNLELQLAELMKSWNILK